MDIIEKDRCTGCGLCKNVCPQKCITMKENEEGFLYPNVDEEKCINCNACKKNCPVLNFAKLDNEYVEKHVYCAILKDSEELLQQFARLLVMKIQLFSGQNFIKRK